MPLSRTVAPYSSANREPDQPIRERRRHPPPFIPVTNCIESMIEICRDHAANVKRWRDGQMVLRWTAAGMINAERSFRRIKGYKQMPQLAAALYRHAHPEAAAAAETVGAAA